MKILLDHADGRYSTRPLTDEEAVKLEADGHDVAHVADDVWAEYLHHCGRDGIWQALWRSISNEQWVRRREKELLPLEDADREIARLKTDLAQAQRMWRYFENEYTRAKGLPEDRLHMPEARGLNEYTCVFPVPGCDVDALEHDDWRVRAVEILEKYSPKLAAEGMRHQGCCCGHTHVLIDEEKSGRLRAAGFLVENDSELEEDDP